MFAVRETDVRNRHVCEKMVVAVLTLEIMNISTEERPRTLSQCLCTLFNFDDCTERFHLQIG